MLKSALKHVPRYAQAPAPDLELTTASCMAWSRSDNQLSDPLPNDLAIPRTVTLMGLHNNQIPGKPELSHMNHYVLPQREIWLLILSRSPTPTQTLIFALDFSFSLNKKCLGFSNRVLNGHRISVVGLCGLKNHASTSILLILLYSLSVCAFFCRRDNSTPTLRTSSLLIGQCRDGVWFEWCVCVCVCVCVVQINIYIYIYHLSWYPYR